MAKRVYISPSDQVENKYAWGNTNEHVQCQRIAEAEAAALRRCGVEVQLAKFGTSMAQRCAESNAFGADIHNCVHTNAFNGKVTGTRLFCFAVPGKGYDACRAIFGALAPLTPGTSENIQANSRLYEVRTPAAPTAYVECEFHDNLETARWIIQHTDEIGEAIARGLCQYLGVNLLQIPGDDLRPPPPVPAGGVIKGDDPPVLTLAAGAGGVGVQSQVKVVVPAVCLADGGRGGHIRGVPGKLDAVGQQIRLHGVGHQIHEIFLRPVPGDIGVIFLGGRTQINFRHGHSPFLVILCQNTGSAHW